MLRALEGVTFNEPIEFVNETNLTGNVIPTATNFPPNHYWKPLQISAQNNKLSS